MQGGGRQLDPVWRFFDRRKKPGNGGHVGKCRGCGEEVNGLTYRLRRHADSCDGLRAMGNDRPQQQQVLAFPKGTASQCATAIARCIFATNLPFSTVSNPAFKSMIHNLNPGTKVPHHSTLATTLLDAEFQAVRKEAKARFSEKWVTVSVDAWSSAKNESLMGSTVDDHLILTCLCMLSPFAADINRRNLENVQTSRSVLDLLNVLGPGLHFSCINVCCIPSHFPVCDGVALMESNTCHVGMAVEIWLELCQRCKGVKEVQERSTMALSSPMFLAANVLDHRYFSPIYPSPQGPTPG